MHQIPISRIRGVPAILLFTLVGACAPPANLIEAAALPAPVQEPYRVQVADVLNITFFRTPELTQTRTVGPDGEIGLTLVGNVPVAGRRVDEIAETINQLYADDLVEPQITVNVQTYSGMRVYVAGEVTTPGMYDYRGGLTLLQAVMNAGGFQNSAQVTQVLLIRRGPGGEPVGSRIDMAQVLKHARFDVDVPLAPSDIIFVPRSTITNINLFVEHYIRNNLPIPLFLGFNVLQD